MGRTKGAGKKKPRVLKRDFKEKRPDEWQERRVPNEDGDGYQKTPTENDRFEEYYKEQGIVPEGEWEDFMNSLRTPLPATFRINGSGKFSAHLRDKLEADYFSQLQQEPLQVEGEEGEEKLIPPRPIPWYPQKLAWQLTYSRTQLRKSPTLKAVHELLKLENSSGGITRQEAVSMAPPLFLDIEPHHKVLDTCAAPGSKTVQMLEMLHESPELPTGFVVANDLEPQRCNLLVHQTNRLNSPALVVTNHDASGFPSLNSKGAPKSEALRFDRILCDVPCSGDGTLRKAPDLWRRWQVNQGTGLHPLQVRITLHSASLLAIGGKMVYSTCSFNPLEDEAVVAEVLRQAQGSLELLDVSERLPELKRCQGKTQWAVKGTKGEYFSSLEEAEKANNANNLSASMFPDWESSALPLERCMRILPHHGDTGGFFIALLQKKAELPPLQPDRWKRTKELYAEKWRERHHQTDPLNATKPQVKSEKAQAEVGTADGKLKDTDDIKPFADNPGKLAGNQEGKQVLEGQQEGESKDKQFNQDMENCADSAAQAAVTFADAIAEQDPEAALAASEEAADAAEEVANLAEALDPRPGERHAEGQGSVHLDDMKEEPAQDVKVETPPSRPGPKHERRRKPGEEPIQIIEEVHLLDNITDFFGLQGKVPIQKQLVTRSGIKDERGPKKIYFVTSGMVSMVHKDEDQALKVTSAGLRVFERNDKKDACQCAYRMSQDGLHALLPYVTRQILHPTAAELLRMLKERIVYLPAPQNPTKPQADSQEPPQKRIRTEASAEEAADESKNQAVVEPKQAGGLNGQGEAAKGPKIPISDLETLGELQSIQGGCCICTLREKEATELGLRGGAGDTGKHSFSQIAFVCWKGRSSISLLVDKASASQMADRLEDALSKFLQNRNPVPQSTEG